MSGGINNKRMNPILRTNNDLLRKESIFTSTFKSRKKEAIASESGELIFKTTTKDELLKIRDKLVKERVKQKKLLAFIFTVVFILTIIISLKVYTSDVNYKKEQKIIARKRFVKEKMPSYNFYLEDGDNWLLKENFHNAIYQYKKALNLHINDSIVNLKLQAAYELHCMKRNKDCDKVFN